MSNISCDMSAGRAGVPVCKRNEREFMFLVNLNCNGYVG